MPDEPKGGEQPASEGRVVKIVNAVKTPLGFLTLTLLIGEGILVALAARASGTDFTILVVGMLLLLFALVLVVIDIAAAEKGRDQGISSGTPVSQYKIVFMGLMVVGLSMYGATLYSERNAGIQKLAKSEAELGAREQEVKKLSKDLETTNASLIRSSAEGSTLERQLAGLSEAGSKRDIELDRARKELNEFSSLKVKYDSLKSDRDELAARIPKLMENLSEVRAVNDQLRKSVDERAGNFDQEMKLTLNQISEQNGRLQRENHELVRRNSALEKSTQPYLKAGIEQYYPESNDFQSDFRALSNNTNRELVFFGVNFYITAGEKRDMLLGLLSRGVAIRFLVFNPYQEDFSKLASDFGQPTENLQNECRLGIDALKNLDREWRERRQTNHGIGTLEIRICESVPRARMYFFDPFEGGKTFVVPHANRLNSGNLPGFLFGNVKDGAYLVYLAGFRQLWDISMPLADFLRREAPKAPAPDAKAQDAKP